MLVIVIVFGTLLVAATLMIVYLLVKRRPVIKEEPGQAMLMLQQQINQLSEQLSNGLTESTKTLGQHLENQSRTTAGIVANVTEKLTELRETNKQVVGFAEQLQSLENILKNPKQRGILGEYYLETLLGNVFQPKQYQLQYMFRNGDKVDAALFYAGKIIPIDAKFSLEKYNQMAVEKDRNRREGIEREFKTDVKKRIDETAKYIRPVEKTTEFAFMFIPAEGVYASLFNYKTGVAGINTHDLLEYAHSKKVYPVSPVNFFAFLQTIIEGLKSQKIEEGVKEIIVRVNQLARHLSSYEIYLSKLGTSIGTTVNMYNNASKEFKKVDKDIFRVTDGRAGGQIEVELLDKPVADED